MSSVLLDLYHRDFSREVERKRKAQSEGSPWVKKIKARYAKSTNANISIIGEPGIGKSTLSLRMAEELMPEFFVDKPQEAVDRFVTFSGGEFGRAIKASPNGAVIIGDEFGQQMHHRMFMSEGSVALSGVLQGFRFKRYICFMNLPALRYIDPDAQGLLTWHAIVREWGVAHVDRVSHPRYRGDDFFHTAIDTLRFKQPGKELWDCYVEKKEVNQEKVFDRAIRLMDDAEGVAEKTDREIADEVVKHPEAFQRVSNGVPEWDATALMDEFHVGSQRAYFIIRRLKRGKA